MKLFVGASHLPPQQGKEFERSVADLFGCAASSSLQRSLYFLLSHSTALAATALLIAWPLPLCPLVLDRAANLGWSSASRPVSAASYSWTCRTVPPRLPSRS